MRRLSDISGCTCHPPGITGQNWFSGLDKLFWDNYLILEQVQDDTPEGCRKRFHPGLRLVHWCFCVCLVKHCAWRINLVCPARLLARNGCRQRTVNTTLATRESECLYLALWDPSTGTLITGLHIVNAWSSSSSKWGRGRGETASCFTECMWPCYV